MAISPIHNNGNIPVNNELINAVEGGNKIPHLKIL